MMEKTNTLIVRTPEGISFPLFLAGPVVRFLAWLIDALVVSVLTKLVGILLNFLVILGPDLANALAIVIFFVLSVGYGIFLEWFWRGQTIGKRLLGLRVMDEQALGLQFSQVVVRNLLRVVDSLPLLYLTGGLSVFISRRAQRLGDLAANTIVIRTPSIKEPDLDQLLADKYNSFNDYPHLEARLRQKTGPREAGLALQALIRRDSFDPEARIGLFRDLADYFRELVQFPPEAVEGISDEQYLRNVIGSVFRSDKKQPAIKTEIKVSPPPS